MNKELLKLIKELTENNNKALSENINLTEFAIKLTHAVNTNSLSIEMNTKAIQDLKKHLE